MSTPRDMSSGRPLDRDDARVVVVGASLAGLRACEQLRTKGFNGRITLVGDEPEAPYDRPPLSKHYLAGAWEADRIRLRKAEELAKLGLDQRLGVRATALHPTDDVIELSDGTQVDFDALVIATGATPRRLPGQPDVHGVAVLRTIADATALRDLLVEGARVVVIGAGFIGLEVAATARGRGCAVTVLEGLPAPLIRGLGAEMGELVAAVHGRHDVDLRCGVLVESIEHDGSRVTGVRVFGDGHVQHVAADVVVVGIGVVPATSWLEGSGLTLGDGVVCDEHLWTGRPGVWAAGDCARWRNTLFEPHDDVEMRIEHWSNAAEQGAAAAVNVLATAGGDAPEPYAAVPFFWSDQFEARIQFLGRAHGGDEVRIIAGDPADGRFAAMYGWEGRLRGVLGVSMPKVVMPCRALLAAKASWDDALAHAATLT